MWTQLVFVLSIIGRSVFATDYPKDACGLRPLVNTREDPSRIVGGKETIRGDWPWKISMRRNGNHVCSGSLLNDQWIVTAAHCVAGSTQTSVYSIVFGLHDRLVSDSWVITRAVQSIIIHPQYTSRNFVNDIALMKLTTKVEPYTEYYMPVCFPSPDQSFANQIGYTVGWGAPNYGGALLRYLNEVTSVIVTDNECRARYSAGSINTAVQICSGGSNKGACQGDSGGPFIVSDPNRDGRYVLAGITSWGIGCGQGGVYTRVSAYKTWIESYVGSVAS